MSNNIQDLFLQFNHTGDNTGLGVKLIVFYSNTEFSPLKQLLEDTRCKNSNCYVLYFIPLIHLFIIREKEILSIVFLQALYSPHQMYLRLQLPKLITSSLFSFVSSQTYIQALSGRGCINKQTNTTTTSSSGSLANTGLNHKSSQPSTFSVYKRGRNFKKWNIINGGGVVFVCDHKFCSI